MTFPYPCFRVQDRKFFRNIYFCPFSLYSFKKRLHFIDVHFICSNNRQFQHHALINSHVVFSKLQLEFSCILRQVISKLMYMRSLFSKCALSKHFKH